MPVSHSDSTGPNRLATTCTIEMAMQAATNTAFIGPANSRTGSAATAPAASSSAVCCLVSWFMLRDPPCARVRRTHSAYQPQIASIGQDGRRPWAAGLWLIGCPYLRRSGIVTPASS